MIKAGPENAQEAFDTGTAIKSSLRRIETLGKPVVAAINGAALGGGYEIALASHHRVALDAPAAQDRPARGDPRPAAAGGGVTRTVRLMGITNTLLKVLLQGTQYSPQRALENGLVHEVAADVRVSPRRAPSSTPTPSRTSPGTSPATESGRHAVEPEVRRQPARLPGQPEEAQQLNGAPYPAPRNDGGRRRGLPGRLRDRAGHRGPLLHRAGHRADLEEHDPGVLLRPPGGQLRRQPSPGHRAAPGPQGRRPAPG